MGKGDYAAALGHLRQAKVAIGGNNEIRRIVSSKDEVLSRFQPLLYPEAIQHLLEEEIRPFFYFENNKHWSGLFRQVNRICGDMDEFRSVLGLLVDESQPITSRLDEAIDRIKGLGKGIITALLQVAYPENYGVWNNTSERGLIATGLMPEFSRGTSFGAKYAQINEVLKPLAHNLEIDLWTLDALWWAIQPGDGGVTLEDELGNEIVEIENGDRAQKFALERHLHNFLFDNWTKTSLGEVWDIYSPPGEPDKGYEFYCGVGKIDILAKHKSEHKWLVVELKRGQTSDAVVGQALRYIGWVKQELADVGDTVEGIIIARNGDANSKLHYALSVVPNLRFLSYKVDFKLCDAPPPEEWAKPLLSTKPGV